MSRFFLGFGVDFLTRFNDSVINDLYGKNLSGYSFYFNSTFTNLLRLEIAWYSGSSTAVSSKVPFGVKAELAMIETEAMLYRMFCGNREDRCLYLGGGFISGAYQGKVYKNGEELGSSNFSGNGYKVAFGNDSARTFKYLNVNARISYSSIPIETGTTETVDLGRVELQCKVGLQW